MGGHVARMGRGQMHYYFGGISEVRSHLEQPGVDGRTDIQEVGLGRH